MKTQETDLPVESIRKLLLNWLQTGSGAFLCTSMNFDALCIAHYLFHWSLVTFNKKKDVRKDTSRTLNRLGKPVKQWALQSTYPHAHIRRRNIQMQSVYASMYFTDQWYTTH